jgi:hypothetical protein
MTIIWKAKLEMTLLKLRAGKFTKGDLLIGYGTAS